jgi:hypothetical protein
MGWTWSKHERDDESVPNFSSKALTEGKQEGFQAAIGG